MSIDTLAPTIANRVIIDLIPDPGNPRTCESACNIDPVRG